MGNHRLKERILDRPLKKRTAKVNVAFAVNPIEDASP